MIHLQLDVQQHATVPLTGCIQDNEGAAASGSLRFCVGDDHREAFGNELVADRHHSREQLELPVRLFTGGATRIRSAPEDACAEGIRFHADFDPVASELS